MAGQRSRATSTVSFGLAVLLLVGAGWLAGPLSNARAAGSQAPFGVSPAQEGQTPLPGGHFSYSVPAGATVTDAIEIANLTQAPLPLQVFAADLIPLSGGGFTVAQLGATMHTVGAWTSVSQPTITLAPQAVVADKFTITVPAGTLSGDYGGAVVVQNAPTR